MTSPGSTLPSTFSADLSNYNDKHGEVKFSYSQKMRKQSSYSFIKPKLKDFSRTTFSRTENY